MKNIKYLKNKMFITLVQLLTFKIHYSYNVMWLYFNHQYILDLDYLFGFKEKIKTFAFLYERYQIYIKKVNSEQRSKNAHPSATSLLTNDTLYVVKQLTQNYKWGLTIGLTNFIYFHSTLKFAEVF